ncbi:MAG: hypothetical protein PSX81_02660 [bacterium]|nr:hypothetical protein [bacterium]
MDITNSFYLLSKFKRENGLNVNANPVSEYKGSKIFLVQCKQFLTDLTPAQIVKKYKSKFTDAEDIKDGTLLIARSMAKVNKINTALGIDEAIQYVLNRKQFNLLYKNFDLKDLNSPQTDFKTKPIENHD